MVVRLVVLVLALLVLVAACSEVRRVERADARALPLPPEGRVPEEGRFRLRWVADELDALVSGVPGIRMGAGQIPKSAMIQVDYAGPKTRIEFFIRNEVGGQDVREVVIHSEPFGAARLEIDGNHASYFDGAPFSSKRQAFLVRVYKLRECDRVNSLLWLASFDAEEQDHYNAVQSEFYAAAFDPAHRGNRTSGGRGELSLAEPGLYAVPFVGPTRDLPDHESPTILWWESERGATRLCFRFVP